MNYIDPALNDLLAKAEQKDSFWVESAKLAFAVELHKRCRAAGISNAQLAKKLGTSPAYITKVFRGDTNFTIETMVKLARAACSSLEVKLVDPSTRSHTTTTRSPSKFVSIDPKTQITVSSASDIRVDLALAGLVGQVHPGEYINLTEFQGGVFNA